MNPIKPIKMSFIEEMKSKYPYGSTSTGIQEEYFSDFNGKMKNIEIDLPIEQNNTKIVKNNNYNLYYTKNYGSMNIYKQVDNINLDPFKYNPNYNSIYKNIPCVKIYSPSKEYLQAKMKKNKILIYRNNNLFYHKKREHSSSSSKNIDIDDNKKENNKNPTNNNIIFDYNKERQAITNFNNKTLKKFNSLSPRKFNYKFKIIKKMKINNIIKDNLKDNHALRFSKYVQRKWNINNNNNNNDILTYINPSSYDTSQKKIKSIDFKKMKPHSFKNIINLNLLKNPSICYYEPKYDSFDKKYSAFFGKKNINKTKKILQKIWSSMFKEIIYQ
jgi:hypothetical protein